MNFEGPVACVFAHPDDEVLGFGASTSKLVSKGIEVYPVLVSGYAEKRFKGDSAEILKDKCKSACNLIGAEEPLFGDFPNLALHNVESHLIVNFIEKAFLKIKPRIIITHHPADLNSDHKVVSELCLAACRLPQRRPDLELPLIRNILFAEILSSTDWSYASLSNHFRPDFYFEVNEYDLSKKWLALKEYGNVARSRPHPRNKKTIDALANIRGSESGVEYAESFQSCFCLYERN